MRVRILQDQADLFEMSILQQSIDIYAVSTEELLAKPSGDPLVIVGRMFTHDRLQEFRRIMGALSQNRTTVLLCAPFGDTDLGRYLETPSFVRIARRTPESEARIVDGQFASELGEEIKIRSDYVIDTALGSGIVAIDSLNKPTLIRYQATNRSGPAFISTLQLLSYTALSNEQHRQKLLLMLLSWHHATAEIIPFPTSLSQSTPSRESLVSVLLGLAAAKTTEPNQLQHLVRVYLGAEITKEITEEVLIYLQREGVLALKAETNKIEISPPFLAEALDGLGLHAYARELTELIEKGEENPL